MNIDRKAKIIRAARQNATLDASAKGLRPGDHVMVEYRNGTNDFQPREAWVDENGCLTVGGCVPSPGMVGKLLSKPWRNDGAK